MFTSSVNVLKKYVTRRDHIKQAAFLFLVAPNNHQKLVTFIKTTALLGTQFLKSK